MYHVQHEIFYFRVFILLIYARKENINNWNRSIMQMLHGSRFRGGGTSHHSAAGLLKRRHTQIKYFQGSLMNPGDLERAKVRGREGLVRD